MAEFRQVQRDLTVKRIDRFVVSFYRIPENEQNVLAEHIRNVSRPSITVQDSEIHNKGRNIPQPAKARFGTISIEFYDDNNSIVIDALYKQIYRQLGRADDAFNGDSERRFNDAKFDVNIKCFNSLGMNVEEYQIRRAFISSLEPGNLNLSSDNDSLITIELVFDDLEYIFDR